MTSTRTTDRQTQVPLAVVLRTGELADRSPRPANFEAENRALAALAKTLASAPLSIFQKLVDTAMTLCDADSAGLSVRNPSWTRTCFDGTRSPDSLRRTPEA